MSKAGGFERREAELFHLLLYPTATIDPGRAASGASRLSLPWSGPSWSARAPRARIVSKAGFSRLRGSTLSRPQDIVRTERPWWRLLVALPKTRPALTDAPAVTSETRPKASTRECAGRCCQQRRYGGDCPIGCYTVLVCKGEDRPAEPNTVSSAQMWPLALSGSGKSTPD